MVSRIFRALWPLNYEEGESRQKCRGEAAKKKLKRGFARISHFWGTFYCAEKRSYSEFLWLFIRIMDPPLVVLSLIGCISSEIIFDQHSRNHMQNTCPIFYSAEKRT